MSLTYGGSGLGLSTQGMPALTNSVLLQAGSDWHVPAGTYWINPGSYSFIQIKDPISGLWRTPSQTPNFPHFINSDGGNIRLVNLTGCALGAYLTNVGSAYTSAPVVTANGTGGSVWKAIVGGAVNGTVTVTAGGSNYLYPPLVWFPPPPVGGVQAQGYATLSAGAISAVTITDQGAGYLVAPVPVLINDARDTTGSGGILTCTLTGSGTITAVVCTNPGIPVTSVPTLTFSGGGGSSAAATAVMCFAATGITVGAGGVAYGNAQPFVVITDDGIVAGAAGAVVNPAISTGLLRPRQAVLSGTSTSGGAVTATGLRITDGGLFQAVPNGFVIAGGTALATTVAQVTITVGGVNDEAFIQPFL